MDTDLTEAEALVRAWKSPGAGREDAPGHPAGEIRLRTPRRLGRRAELLCAARCGHDTYADAITITTTMSTPCR